MAGGLLTVIFGHFERLRRLDSEYSRKCAFLGFKLLIMLKEVCMRVKTEIFVNPASSSKKQEPVVLRRAVEPKVSVYK